MKLPVSYGNRKLDGKNVMIFNITSASDCEADRLGMCPYGVKNGNGICYALRAERMYKQTIPYRKRQTEWWNNHFSPDAFVEVLKPGTEYFRFSEAGDFRNQNDVDKMTEVCELLEANSIICYGYTRRYDLDLSKLSKVCSLIVSGKSVPGCGTSIVLPKGSQIPDGYHLCPGKHCMTECKMCAEKEKKIAFYKH